MGVWASSARNPPEFVQPSLSRSKWHRSNTPKCAPSQGGNNHAGTMAALCQAIKRAQTLTFWARRLPGGVGVFHTGQGRKVRTLLRKFVFLWQCSKSLCKKVRAHVSQKFRTSSTTTRDRNLQFRGAFSTGFFCFFSSIYVQFSKTSPLKSGESSEKSSAENRVKSCHVCGCHGFFRP